MSAPTISTLPNLRDLGGHSTSGGARVRSGAVYRSVDLSGLDDPGLRALAQLDLRTVYDLRSAQEREQRPDRVPSGVRSVELDVLADSRQKAPAQLSAILDDPRVAEDALGHGRAAEVFADAYRDIVSLPSALRAYRGLYRGLLEVDGHASLIHCTTGKDRTGWAAASLLLVLGVDEEAVLADYLRTNDDLLPALRPVFDRFAEAGGDPTMLLPILGVREEYLITAMAEAEARFGSIEGYVRTGLGLAEEELTTLRTALLDGE